MPEQSLAQERMQAICRLAEERFGATAAARLAALLEGAALPLLPEGDAPHSPCAETPRSHASRSPNTAGEQPKPRRL